MKNFSLISFSLLFALLTACSGGGNQTSSSEAESTSEPMEAATGEAQSYSVDADASMVQWEGNMLGMYSHSGNIEVEEGSLMVQGDDVVGGTITIDMSSITPTDENYDPSKDRTKAKLIGHLSSNDFFNVEEYPTATFEITGSQGDQLMGNLTIRGNTNEETVENVSFNPETGTATGTLTFDRTKYDVNFQMTAQDMVLSDEIELQIELKTASQNM